MNWILPKISIITPTLNQGEFIEQTILSVLNQGYPNLEYIVVDGGSTDGTLKILKKYENKLAWLSESDRGQSHAINKGFRMATGQVLAYLNSDDLYEPEALLRVGRFFYFHPEASWLTGKCRIIDHNGDEIRRAITFYKNLWLRVCKYQVLLVLDFISQPATFWHRRVLEREGYLDEALFYTLDYDYSLRVGQHFKLWVMNEILASFRVHPASKTTYSARDQFNSDLDVAGRYTSSPVLRYLHAVHNELIIKAYQIMIAK